MDVGFVNVGTDDKSVFSLGEAGGQLIAQAVCLLWSNLTWNKGLTYCVGDHIIGPAPSAGPGYVLPFGEKKFSVSDSAVTLIAGDKSAAVSLVWIFNIVNDTLNGCSHRPALANV